MSSAKRQQACKPARVRADNSPELKQFPPPSGGMIGADVRPNWKEQPPRESLVGKQWRDQ
jgi:hypothetical protein